MYEEQNRSGSRVVVCTGNVLALDSLSSPRTIRWVVSRKAEVLAAIRNGLLGLEDACDRYTLTMDEIISWHVAYNRYGLNGLRAMHAQAYRRHVPSSDGPGCSSTT